MSAQGNGADNLSGMRKPCDEPCPKCGSTDIHREHHANGSKWSVDEDTGDYCARNKFAASHNYRTVYATREHIAHHCRTCQYDWQGAPLPKPKRPKPSAEPFLLEALGCVVEGLELRGLTKPEDWPHDERLYVRAVEAVARARLK